MKIPLSCFRLAILNTHTSKGFAVETTPIQLNVMKRHWHFTSRGRKRSLFKLKCSGLPASTRILPGYHHSSTCSDRASVVGRGGTGARQKCKSACAYVDFKAHARNCLRIM